MRMTILTVPERVMLAQGRPFDLTGFPIHFELRDPFATPKAVLGCTSRMPITISDEPIAVFRSGGEVAVALIFLRQRDLDVVAT